MSKQRPRRKRRCKMCRRTYGRRTSTVQGYFSGECGVAYMIKRSLATPEIDARFRFAWTELLNDASLSISEARKHMNELTRAMERDL